MDMKKAELVNTDYALTMYAEDRETAVKSFTGLSITIDLLDAEQRTVPCLRINED